MVAELTRMSTFLREAGMYWKGTQWNLLEYWQCLNIDFSDDYIVVYNVQNTNNLFYYKLQLNKTCYALAVFSEFLDLWCSSIWALTDKEETA